MERLRIILIFCFILGISTLPKASSVKTIKLSSGYEMPVIGLGTGQLAPEYIDVAVSSALENGYRHIDTAFVYGNEEAIGKALKKWFDKGNKREDLFITTKLPPFAMRTSDIENYLKLSLERLGLDYVNMYLLHKPFGFVKDKYKFEPAMNEDGSVVLDLNTNHVEIWKAMEKQVKEGRTRSIGLSNFNESQILRVYDSAEIKPSNLQIELHAYNQQKPLRDFCASRNITVTGFSTLGTPDTPKFMKTNTSLALPRLLDHPVVKKIAEKHHKTSAQILLRHSIQNGIVVLPKSTNPIRIKENIQVFDFNITEDEMKELNGIDKGNQGRIFHFLVPKGVEKHPQYPFAHLLN